MMSAVNTLTPADWACSWASFVTGTSKAKMTAYFFLPFSSIVLALITSFLCTGPMLIPDTGILTASERRNSSSASNEPSVDACTQTPSPAQTQQVGACTGGNGGQVFQLVRNLPNVKLMLGFCISISSQ